MDALLRRLDAIGEPKPILRALQLATIHEAQALVPRKTGHLQRNIKPGAVTNDHAIVKADTPYAAPVEFGSKPHVIRPRNARVLAWGGSRRLSGRLRSGSSPTHFAAQGPARITVANRTLERAEALAHRFNARVIELRDLGAHLHEHDIVVSCTASSLPILGKGMVERALKTRRRQPMFMVDLAVPRDIEPEAGELEDVFLYTVDDLKDIVQGNMDSRRSAVQQAEVIIDAQVAYIVNSYATRFTLGYRNSKAGDDEIQALFLGAQVQKF